MSSIFAINPDSTPAAFGRRGFLKATVAAAAGFTIGFRWAGPTRRALAATASAFEPNAFLRVAPDNSVKVIAKHLEMGGAATRASPPSSPRNSMPTGRRSASRVPQRTPSYTTTWRLARCRAPEAAPRSRIPGCSCARPERRRAPCWSPPQRPNGTSLRLRLPSIAACSATRPRSESQFRRTRRQGRGATAADQGRPEGPKGL
jgi:hypothetical protein